MPRRERDLNWREKMDRQAEWGMLSDYRRYMQQNHLQHSSQLFDRFKMQWQEQMQRQAEQRRIENAQKEFDVLAPGKLKYETDTAKARADVEIAKSLELEKKRPWNPEHDPITTANRGWGETSGRVALAGRDPLADPQLAAQRGATRTNILSALMDPNVKNPVAIELQKILDQYVAPDQHNAIKKQLSKEWIKGKDPE